MIENIYKFIIGVDFDNTIISYDDLLYKVAEERGISVPYVHARTVASQKGPRHPYQQLACA